MMRDLNKIPSKDAYTRAERIIKRIQNNADKIVRFENLIDHIGNEEIKFQARVAVLNYHRETL